MPLDLSPYRRAIEEIIDGYSTGSHRITNDQCVGAAVSILTMLEAALDRPGTTKEPSMPVIRTIGPVPVTFDLLREANITRLPTFRNAKGELSHPTKDGEAPGGDWSDADWFVALTGELGELGDLMKKVRRGDLTKEEAQADLGREIADVMTYLDILAFRLGVDVGKATVAKFNEVSERVKSPVRIQGAMVVTLAPGEEA